MTGSLQLRIGDASIWAAPSVHFRLAFAEEVNWLCSTQKPDAIAVELGPATVAAATSWLRELGVAPGRDVKLPCMLGLMKPNRRIRPSFQKTAVRLQELTGKELHELSPDLLHRYLEYSAFTLLPLSSTDSIIEAMRCALELNIPVYGVDLEETAERHRKAIMLQDPASASGALEDYVRLNGTYAEQQRDDEVDSRRELAMAARLKGLAATHKRIVFVCGLAHWRSLRTLLMDASPKPALYPAPTENDLDLFTRVILHPLLAIHHLDTFPVFTDYYEDQRKSASPRKTSLRGATRDWYEVFQEMLENTYLRHFLPEDSPEQLDRDCEDFDSRDAFQSLLRNLCVLRQCRTPDIFTAMGAARGVMSEGFCRKLADVCMEIEWAAPCDYPDLAVLRPSPPSAGRGTQASAPDSALRAELIAGDGWRSQPFFVQSFPGRCSIPLNIIRWKWPNEVEPAVPPLSSGTETWVPTEDLINALLFRAIRLARSQDTGPHIELFEGSLLDGIDVKTTIRSAAKGDDQIYVRCDPRQQVHISSSDEDADLDGFPVVWLFRLADSARWEWKFSADSLQNLHDEYPKTWDEAKLPSAGLMFTAVAAVTDSRVDVELSREGYEVRTDSIIGKLSYWPQCCVRRTAEWAIETKLTRNPVGNEDTIEDLRRLYRERYGIELVNEPWHLTLIRMAIPFARRAITVVAPDGHTLPSSVYQDAARRRVQVRVVPLSYFPSDILRRISRVVWLPVVRRIRDETGIDYPVFPEHVVRHFDERMDAYRRLIPDKWH